MRFSRQRGNQGTRGCCGHWEPETGVGLGSAVEGGELSNVGRLRSLGASCLGGEEGKW